MSINEIDHSKLDPVLKLAWEVFMEFEAPDYPEEGISEFMISINNPSYLDMHSFYGAYEDGKLVGMIATCNLHHHIGLLFVDKHYHRKGIGRSLIQHIIDLKDQEPMTVNSSPYAHDFYQKMGFEDTTVEQIINGIKYYPMIRK